MVLVDLKIGELRVKEKNYHQSKNPSSLHLAKDSFKSKMVNFMKTIKIKI